MFILVNLLMTIGLFCLPSTVYKAAVDAAAQMSELCILWGCSSKVDNFLCSKPWSLISSTTKNQEKKKSFGYKPSPEALGHMLVLGGVFQDLQFDRPQQPCCTLLLIAKHVTSIFHVLSNNELGHR